MELKRVTFEVAKALKEAGYPQNPYNTEVWYKETGESIISDLIIDGDISQETLFAAPYALEVWLWLWRKKNIRIYTRDYYGDLAVSESSSSYDSINHVDPEEAIITAIEYLVDNDLLK